MYFDLYLYQFTLCTASLNIMCCTLSVIISGRNVRLYYRNFVCFFQQTVITELSPHKKLDSLMIWLLIIVSVLNVETLRSQ